MNRKNVFAYGMMATAALLMLAGCHKPTITADYTMPPKAVSDIKGIDTMELVVNVSIAGSKDAADAAIAKAVISEKIAAGFGNEGFFRTTDAVWGDPMGARNLHTVLQAKKSNHGYVRVVTDPVKSRARMEVTFNANLNAGVKQQNVTTNLKKVIYARKTRPQTIYWGRGEKKKSQTIQVPYSVPVQTIASTAVSAVPQYWNLASGSMDVKVIDKNGKTVYQKKFDKLLAGGACDHSSLKALPGTASLFSSMIRRAVTTIVRDLSPYKESKTVKINKDGNEQGFLLLSALAFPEAFDTFQNIKEEDRTFADWENLGVICEALGDYETALECYETALKVKADDKGFFDYDEKIAEEGVERIKTVISGQEKLEKLK